MADTKTEKQKVQEITEKLEQGLQELFESEKYKSYLSTMSKFHNYSFNNTLLIAMQKPDATLVAGFKAWQKNFERHVNKGEKGIRILAPAPYKIKEEREKIDPVTNEPMIDKDGMPVMEEVEIKIPAFRAVTVFDVSQTDGKELPELAVNELLAEVDGYQDFMKALDVVSPVPIEYEDIPGDAKGYFSIGANRIAIQEGMSESQTVKTAIHEVAHAKLHSREREKETDISEHKDRNTKEVEAESVAYTVCQHFGIDTSDYSFGYIAGWSSGKEMAELKSSLDTIRRTSSELISGIETQLQELKKERVTEQEQTQDIVLLVENTDHSEYDLLNVRGMSGEELVTSLADMNDDDRLSVEAYLESKGAWVTPLADEQVEEVEEYHLDYIYNTDTFAITDVKTKMEEHEKDVESEAELSIMQQAELLINEIEHEKNIFSDDERNLIINYAYKIGDMEKTRELAENIAMNEENSPNLVAQTVINAQAEIDALPDGMVGLSEMHEYGYTWAEMLPLTQEKALELFDHDLPLYRLYEDGSEVSIYDRSEVIEHEGLFGIEKGDWEQYVELQTMNVELEESSANREAQLLYGSNNQFGIYQLNDSPQARDIHFMNSNYLEMKGIAVSRENYDLVYTAPLEEGTGLEDIYVKFNIDHPKDFRGHSLSVSDVVVLHQNGENTYHFVDSFGYKEVPEFIQEIAQERETEQTSVIDKTMDIENDKVSYYVIADLSTWAENSPERSELERFNSFEEALDKFKAYREKDAQFSDTEDKARTTLGFNVHGTEFDVIHARNNENVLSLDFTHSSEATQSNRFMDDLQILCNELVDKVRVHRDMTPKEVKDFVKRRFENHLHSTGIEDASMYMDRFDTLYEQGKMEHLMPTANQRHIVEDIPLEIWDNPYFELNDVEQMAFSIHDKFVSIQCCDGGYDYSIYNADYSLIDGGVYDNLDISIHAALRDILEDIGVKATDKRIPVDYEELSEKGEAAELAAMEARRIVSDFKDKTREMFHDIKGQSADDVEQTVYAYILAKLEEYEIPADIVDVVVSGSRCRGLEQKGSDLDVVVEYRGSENEDDLFNAFNEDGLMIGGVKVDINPITEGKTGTLSTYLPGVESYLAEKRENIQKEIITETEQKETVITLTVAECGEFHNLGEFHEGIETVDEAIKLFMQIPPERMHGIPSIGINIHTKGTENFQDVGMDIISGKIADLEMLEYVPDISDNPKAIELIGELIEKLPDIEVRGSFERFQTAVLAAQIDQLSYDFDTYQYLDTVDDRDAQIATIAEDIRSGNTGYLHDFLNAIVSDSIREGIVDVFGQGMDTDNSEAIQTVRKAQELLEKLSAYKPLAKVEELEEGNYNMVDNVPNNGVEKKEQERTSGRISIREKLAEKKAVIEHKDKALPKEPDKKAQREI